MSGQQALEPIQPTQEVAFLQFLERAASDTAVDVDKLERIMAMHKEMLQLRAQGEYTVAMAKAQTEMPPVVCDKVNLHTKSKYPSIEAVQDGIKEIYLSNGFTCIFSEGSPPANGMIHVIGTVRHVGGHVEIINRYAPADTAGPSGTKNKTEVQGSQSTVSYISRRMLCSIFGVTILGDDKDGNADREMVSKDQIKTLKKLATDCGADTPELVRYLLNLDDDAPASELTLDKLPASFYETAVKALKRKQEVINKAK